MTAREAIGEHAILTELRAIREELHRKNVADANGPPPVCTGTGHLAAALAFAPPLFSGPVYGDCGICGTERVRLTGGGHLLTAHPWKPKEPLP